jgi:ABC-type uncharacterized transport system ATPase subunit
MTNVMADLGRAPLTRAPRYLFSAHGIDSDTQERELVVQVRDLRKSYGEVEAVRGVSLEVGRGEVFCLLGPNGAGKTTIVEILEGYRTRSGG